MWHTPQAGDVHDHLAGPGIGYDHVDQLHRRALGGGHHALHRLCHRPSVWGSRVPPVRSCGGQATRGGGAIGRRRRRPDGVDQAVDERGLGVDQLLPGLRRRVPPGAVDLRVRTGPAGPGRPLDGEGPALDGRRVEVAPDRPRPHVFSAALDHLAEVDPFAGRHRGAELLAELPFGGGQGFLAGLRRALGDGPPPLVPPGPVGTTRVDQEDLDVRWRPGVGAVGPTAADPPQEDPGAERLGHDASPPGASADRLIPGGDTTQQARRRPAGPGESLGGHGGPYPGVADHHDGDVGRQFGGPARQLAQGDVVGAGEGPFGQLVVLAGRRGGRRSLQRPVADAGRRGARPRASGAPFRSRSRLPGAGLDRPVPGVRSREGRSGGRATVWT